MGRARLRFRPELQQAHLLEILDPLLEAGLRNRIIDKDTRQLHGVRVVRRRRLDPTHDLEPRALRLEMTQLRASRGPRLAGERDKRPHEALAGAGDLVPARVQEGCRERTLPLYLLRERLQPCGRCGRGVVAEEVDYYFPCRPVHDVVDVLGGQAHGCVIAHVDPHAVDADVEDAEEPRESVDGDVSVDAAAGDLPGYHDL